MAAPNGGVKSFEDRKNFFANLAHEWPEVTEDGKIETEKFLNASHGIVNFFDIMGKTFTPLKLDVNGNIQKLRKKFVTNPSGYHYINDMILAEVAANEYIAIESLLWLKRALHFVHLFLQQVTEDQTKNEDLTPFCRNAYEVTLKNYHGWVVQKLFPLFVKALAYRKDFLKTLACDQEGMEDSVIVQMKEFNEGLGRNINAVIEFYRINNLDSEKKV